MSEELPKRMVKIEVAGTNGPVPKVDATPKGIRVRIDFRDRPTHWVEIHLAWSTMQDLHRAVGEELRKRTDETK